MSPRREAPAYSGRRSAGADAREVRAMSEQWGALARVVPRATVYAARAARPAPGHPVPALRRSPWTWAQVLVDDAVVTVAHVRGRDEVQDFDRLDADARDAVDVMTRAGAFTDASVLFPTPRPV